MSVREEEQRKSNCPSRGLGLAAAAIGVGVGAALYYFFSKGPEHPSGAGTTSEGWRSHEPQTLDATDDEYTTISENSTTDTSMFDDSFACSCLDTSNTSIITTDHSLEDCMMVSEYTSDESSSVSEENTAEEDRSDNETSNTSGSFEHASRRDSVWSNSDVADDWDVTNSSVGIPDMSSGRSPLPSNNITVSSSTPRDGAPLRSYIRDLTAVLHSRVRERSWSLEECAICFEIMLRDQELMALPCTHNFHVTCIGPWLQEQQTCPICRKAVE